MRCWFCISSSVLIVVVLGAVARAEDDEGRDQFIAAPAYAEASLKQTLKALADEAALRRIDEEALGHAQRFASGEHAASPGMTADGSVQFVFASSEHRVFCQHLQLCDIELQRGEKVHRVLVSDKSQWLHDESFANGTTHVVVQPTVPNTTCSMGIYTDRRVYYVTLVSTVEASRHMPRVRFLYPEDDKARWEAEMQQAGRLAADEPAQREPVEVRPEHLFFGYEIEKEGRWRVRRKINWAPVRAFDDGEKTYIEMPRSMLSGEAPILLMESAEGKAAIVNYRLKGLHFIVDRLFRSAILVNGTGRKQERVRITREED